MYWADDPAGGNPSDPLKNELEQNSPSLDYNGSPLVPESGHIKPVFLSCNGNPDTTTTTTTASDTTTEAATTTESATSTISTTSPSKNNLFFNYYKTKKL